MKPIIAITMGDFNGIGPEVALRSVVKASILNICTPLLVGSPDVFEFYAKRCRLEIKLSEVDDARESIAQGSIAVLRTDGSGNPRVKPGTPTTESGRLAGEAIVTSSGLCSQRLIDGMVTAPVSKAVMNKAGFGYPGQTEMLASLTHSNRVVMMLIAGSLRVGLATVHVPLKNVSRRINPDAILEKLSVIHGSLRKDFGLGAPKIAVLGLNPHAGEQGLLGTEERDFILPAIHNARRKRMLVDGPFPADGFFGTHSYRGYDAVLAMYHDQGLIPLKMKGFSIGVNFSAGLAIVRTSPDHGTAFDIAGKNVADAGSMVEAVKLAVSIVLNRQKPGH